MGGDSRLTYMCARRNHQKRAGLTAGQVACCTSQPLALQLCFATFERTKELKLRCKLLPLKMLCVIKGRAPRTSSGSDPSPGQLLQRWHTYDKLAGLSLQLHWADLDHMNFCAYLRHLGVQLLLCFLVIHSS